MRLRNILASGAIAVGSVAGFAQTVTGSGSANSIPKFTGSSNPSSAITNSSITDANGKVGIGTTQPAGLLDVAGPGMPGGFVVTGINIDGNNSNFNASFLANSAKLATAWNRSGGDGEADFLANRGAGVGGGFAFYDVTNGGAINQLMNLNGNGNVGIGIASPTSRLDVAGKIHATDGVASGNQQTLIGYSGIPGFGGLNAGQPIFISNGGDGGNNQFFYNIYENYASLTFGAVNFGSSAYGGVNANSFSTLFRIDATGAVYTGRPQSVPNSNTTNPSIFISNTLDNGAGDMAVSRNLGVAGNLALTGGGAHMTYPDGTVQSTAWNGTTCGGDYAESIDVTGDRKSYEPGDVLVVDPKVEGKFLKSSEPYATTVMGIYSTQPGLTGRRVGAAKTGEEVPMAMLGIVPTKVSAENGPIKPGDLLVTSSTPGYAMKGTDRSRMLGALIGKALGHLDSGSGVIEVGIALQ